MDSDPGGGVVDSTERVASEERADVVVLGCFGNKGARIGSLGNHALWAAKSLTKATVVRACHPAS